MFRRLETMVDRVANQVHQRVGQLFNNEFVDLGLRTRHHQADLLIVVARHLPDTARQLIEQLPQGYHAHREDTLLKLAELPLQASVHSQNLACKATRSRNRPNLF